VTALVAGPEAARRPLGARGATSAAVRVRLRPTPKDPLPSEARMRLTLGQEVRPLGREAPPSVRRSQRQARGADHPVRMRVRPPPIR